MLDHKQKFKHIFQALSIPLGTAIISVISLNNTYKIQGQVALSVAMAWGAYFLFYSLEPPCATELNLP